MRPTRALLITAILLAAFASLACGLATIYATNANTSNALNTSLQARPQPSACMNSSTLVLTIINPPSPKGDGTDRIYHMPMIPATSLYYTARVTHSSDPAIAEDTIATLVLNFNPGQPPSCLAARSPGQLVPGAVLGISNYTYDNTYPPYGKIEVDIPVGTDWKELVSLLSSPVAQDSGAPILTNVSGPGTRGQAMFPTAGPYG